MSTQNISTPRRNTRPELRLLAALIVFGLLLAARFVWVSLQPTETAPVAPVPVALGSEDMIGRLQETLRQNPDNSYAYAQLGLAYLEQVRETSDPQLYTRAESAFAEALKRDPNQLDAITGQGILALARHDFEEALTWAEKGLAINPYRAQLVGIQVDGLVELGRYDEAVETLQKMVDMRPDLTSYSRVSYLRELYGDTPGAIQAMAQAAEMGVPGVEGTLWTEYQLGTLHFNSGDLEQAEAVYQSALRSRPDYLPALAGMANIKAARGEISTAIADYNEIVKRLPQPSYVIALGELYEVIGQPAQAEAQYTLVRAMQTLNESAGMNVDLELALFDADHGADPQKALERARAAYEKRPSIYAADALAWSLYQTGNYAEARKYSDESLKLGTRDANLWFRAGMIRYKQGDLSAAKEALALALEINPHFSLRHAPTAQKLLAELP